MNQFAQYSPFFHFCVIASLILLVAAMTLSFCRLIIGKTLPDRVVALDNISMVVICLITVFSIITNHPVYVDIVIALALITFLGMIAFAQFIEWQQGKITPNNRWREK